MKRTKIAIITGVNNNIDVTRGLGVHNSELFKAINNLKRKDIEFVNNPIEANVIHITKFHPFFISLPFFKSKNQKWILTIHDLIPLIYPDVYKSGIRGKVVFLINKFLIWRNIDQIITISETSKKDICRFLGVNPEIVNVIYLAPKSAIKQKKVEKKYNLPKKFVLYTGDINYNKNIPNLIKACEIAKIPLVIAGKQALEIEKMDLKHPETLHFEGVNLSNVIRLGFVSDEDLNNLYNLAYCYVQPSFYEGFGLPALEAAVCKTPLVVSKTQALVEILGSGLDYIDPNDVKDIARGILNPNINIKIPRKYSWERTAKETLEVYAKA